MCKYVPVSNYGMWPLILFWCCVLCANFWMRIKYIHVISCPWIMIRYFNAVLHNCVIDIILL